MALTLYRRTDGTMQQHLWQVGEPIPTGTVWIDMLCPTLAEEEAVESHLGMDVPTREELSEIELSSRLYQEGDAQFMTATMLSKVESGRPETHAATFILVRDTFITLRYVDTTSFHRFNKRVMKMTATPEPAALFVMVIDTIVNRMADILERLDRDIDSITKAIFSVPGEKRDVMNIDFQAKLEHIGRCGDLSSKVHDSLLSFSRLVVYAPHHDKIARDPLATEITSIRADILGLSDHTTYLTGKVNFLLDATLGMISIQQNGVFKVLSIASLVLMPPTLVAGLYGMNFKFMPELNWHYGYPLALGIMVLSAILPYAYLRSKKML
jgi:magnesium transporter